MLDVEVLVPTPPVPGDVVRLEPLGLAVLEDYQRMLLADGEGRRLTGTHRRFTRDDIVRWLETRSAAPLRADWAIVHPNSGAFLGEAVLLDVDPDNRRAGFRISLVGPEVYGLGYGTAATRMVVDFAFATVGLHRVQLEVFAFNTRAIAAYRSAGFLDEGRLRDSLWWEGEWHDAIVMSRLSTDPKPGDEAR